MYHNLLPTGIIIKPRIITYDLVPYPGFDYNVDRKLKDRLFKIKKIRARMKHGKQ